MMYLQTHELQTKSKNLAELETKLRNALARSGQVSNADILKYNDDVHRLLSST
jgi:hypothetical protein